jgi:drug/metabolite transporter (DMT)-like permease
MANRPISTQRSISASAWAMMALLGVIWGGSFTANHAALAEVPVLTAVAFRIGGAAICLWLVIAARQLPVPFTPRSLAIFATLGVLNNVLPFCLIVWGQSHIASGLAAILNATTAIVTVALATMFFPDERLTPQKAVGVALGLFGVIVIIGPSALGGFSLGSLGQIAVLGATVCYAASGVFARRHLTGLRPEVSAAGMLTAASIIMIPLALWHDGAPTWHYRPETWVALAYLAVISTAVAYMLYYTVLRMAGAGNVSLVTLMVPPVSVVLGALLFDEALKPSAYVGFILLACGLMIIDGRLRHLRRARA